MGAFVVAWYARTGGNQALELPAPVELEDAVAIADWLLLPLSDLSQVTYAAGAEDGNLARKVRAKAYIKLREDRVKTMVAITESIENAPKHKYRFAFFSGTDDVEYIKKTLDEGFDTFLPVIYGALREAQEARFGNKDSAYEWAQCKQMCDEAERELKGYGFAARWAKERFELSGPRGMDFPPMDLGCVYGFRQVLTVELLEAKPAVKRRRV
jgi:hypothetical protein